MARIQEFPLPDLGEGLTEGEILRWLVAEGDVVTLNQPIVEVETAKAAVEIPAKWAGRVTRIFHPEGSVVEVGALIVAIDTQPDAGPLAAADGGSSGDSDAPIAAGLIGGPAPGGRTAVLVGYGPKTTTAARRPRASGAAPAAPLPAPVAAPVPAPVSVAPAVRVAPAPASAFGAASSVAAGAGPALAKPPVRKLARDLGVDLRQLSGTGPAGSISRADVQAWHAGAVGEGGGVQSASIGGTAVPAAALVSPATAPVFGPNREQRIAVKGVRRLTAENMVASAFTAPHVTEFLQVDVTRSIRALDRLRELPQWRGVRVSPLLLAARAVLWAIRRHPMINSTWSAETGEIIVKEYVNLGIAAATPRGLLVPNIKDAGRLSLRELADAMTALVSTAKEGRTQPAEMAHGTFTITNVGVFGVDTGTPILPPGEAAILAFGAIKEMPWAHQGKVRLRQVTTLGLSFDHRIVDGELGSRFLQDIGAFLADPSVTQLSWS